MERPNAALLWVLVGYAWSDKMVGEGTLPPNDRVCVEKVTCTFPHNQKTPKQSVRRHATTVMTVWMNEPRNGNHCKFILT
jgi:hypothetical protein